MLHSGHLGIRRCKKMPSNIPSLPQYGRPRHNLPEKTFEGFEFLQHDIRNRFPDELENIFDFAHQRNVLEGAYGVPLKQAIQDRADAIKPGGWGLTTIYSQKVMVRPRHLS